jgi:hypothetical protein
MLSAETLRANALKRWPALMPAWLKPPELDQRVLLVACSHADMGPAIDRLSGWLDRVTGRVYPYRVLVAGGAFVFTEFNFEQVRLLGPEPAKRHRDRVRENRRGLWPFAPAIDVIYVIGHTGGQGSRGHDGCKELQLGFGHELSGLTTDENVYGAVETIHREIGMNLVRRTLTNKPRSVPTIGWMTTMAGRKIRECTLINHIGAEELIG